MDLLELVVVALTLSVLLLPVHLGVFWIQKRRGNSVGQAARFSLVGVLVVFAFVFGLTALGNLWDSDGSRRTASDCGSLGGVEQPFTNADGTIGSICIVGS